MTSLPLSRSSIARAWWLKLLLCLLIAMGISMHERSAATAYVLDGGAAVAAMAHDDDACADSHSQNAVCCYMAAGCALYLPQTAAGAGPNRSDARWHMPEDSSVIERATPPGGHPPRLLTQG